jgi:tetratricopeptide (TPR) repeat protein
VGRFSRIALAGLCAALVAVSFAAYSGALSNGFVNYDDEGYVTDNAHVRGGLSPASVAWAFTTTAQANWHPATWISHMLDVTLFGLDAGRHHATSVGLHACNAVLLFLVLVAMTRAPWRSALAAGLFAVHPLHVESVAWIAERKDVLSTLFWLLTLAAWLFWLERKTTARYGLVVALFAFGLMSKPMLVTLPFTLLLLDFWPLGRKAPLREKAPLFAMSLASCVATYVAQRSGGALQGLSVIPWTDRIANSALSYASYLLKLAWPGSLAVFYPYPHIERLAVPVILSALFVAGTTAGAVALRNKAPYLAVGWLWYLGTLVPVIGWVQVGAQGMADRYTYVPLIGIFIAIAWSAGELDETRRPLRCALAAASVVWLASLVVVTRATVRHWSDARALFSHALAVTEDNWLAHNNLAAALSAAGNQSEAIAHLEASLRIRPGYGDAHYNLGVALARSGRPVEALRELDRARGIGPDSAKIQNNIAGALAATGRIGEATDHLREALRLDPDNVEAHFNLANASYASGRFDDAIEHFAAVLRLSPGDAEAQAGLTRAQVARR